MHKVTCFCFRVDISHRDFTMTVFDYMVKWARYRERISPVAPGLGFSNLVTIRARDPFFLNDAQL